MDASAASHTPRGGPHAAAFRAAIAYGDLTYDQLSLDLGVSRKTLARWAAGESRPRLEHRLQLTELCGVPAAFLEHGFAKPAETEIDGLRRTVETLSRYVAELRQARDASSSPGKSAIGQAPLADEPSPATDSFPRTRQGQGS